MNHAFEQPTPVTQKKEGRDTVVDRVVVSDKETENAIMHLLVKHFKEKTVFGIEREKTENESQILAYFAEHMPAFVAQYGGAPVNFTPDHVHILDPRKFPHEYWLYIKDHGGDSLRAFYRLAYQGIVMFMRFKEDEVEFANMCTHELMHMHSFQSLQQLPHDNDSQFYMGERRSGMQIVGNGEDGQSKKGYLNWLNEAITEELSVRFAKEHLGDIPGIEEGMNKRRELMPNEYDVDLYTRTHIHDVKHKSGAIYHRKREHFVYTEFREELNFLIDEIYHKRSDYFASREAVFDVFARAYFTGRMMPVVRMFDDVFGKGAFVAMAREKSDNAKLDNYGIILNKEE